MVARRHVPALALLGALLPALACGPEPIATGPADPGVPAFGHASTHLVVNSVADPGTGGCTAEECTLREAIAAANADPDLNEISFARKLPAVITLAPPGSGGGELVIAEDLAISGPSGGITIQRNSADPDFRIFRIDDAVGGTLVRLSRLTVQGGRLSASNGGGIFNRGELTLVNTTVRGNSAMGAAGILNFGDLVVSHSTVTGNTAVDAAGTMGGGGISNGTSDATALISHSTISGNSVTGVNHGGGGGIWNVGLLTVENSTIWGNLSDEAGGGVSLNATVNEGGIATITNSTISGNSAGTAGGGIHILGDNVLGQRLTLTNSTLTGNAAGVRGGGFDDASAASMAIINSIVALNTAPAAPDFAGTATIILPGTAVRFSLIGIGNGSLVDDGVDGNRVGTATSPLDPKLGGLASNGGSTWTHALKPGSPALDAASTAECPGSDQRGVLRPQGSACDIGSYERPVKGGK